MNVAFVADVAYPFVKGGGEKRIHEIGTRLSARGHDVSLYTRHWWDGSNVIDHDGMTLRGVAPATALYRNDGTRSMTGALGFAARVYRPLRARMDEHDLVVAMAAPYFHVLTAAAATRGGTPLAVTWHEVWLDHWEEYLGWIAPGGKAVERLIARVPHQPIAVSEFTADRLARLGPDRRDIAVVHNGIDFDRVQAAAPASPGFDVLFAGRLIADKNVDLLLEVFADVCGEGNERLGVIGDGPRLDQLEAQAEALPVDDRITFTGELEAYDDVLGNMRRADVFVSPSIREGFGLTLLEAMAADCTVIAADHPRSAAAEVVGDAGFLVDPEMEALSRQLAAALDGERPPRAPTERAREFDWERVTTDAEELYASLAVEGRR